MRAQREVAYETCYHNSRGPSQVSRVCYRVLQVHSALQAFARLSEFEFTPWIVHT